MTSDKQLYRPTDDRLLAGVCSGLAVFFGLDPAIVRLVWIVLTLFGGSGVLLYVAGWAVIPDDRGNRAALPLVLLVLVFGVPVMCSLVAACIGMFMALVSGN